jgi:hypothetical protein
VCYDPRAGEACCVGGTLPPIVFAATATQQCCGNLSWGAPQGPRLFNPETEFCCGYWPEGPHDTAPFTVTTPCDLAPGVNNSARCCGSGDAMKYAYCCASNATCYMPFFPFGGEGPAPCCLLDEFGCGTMEPRCCKTSTEVCCATDGDGQCCPSDTVCCTEGSGCCPPSNPKCCVSH